MSDVFQAVVCGRLWNTVETRTMLTFQMPVSYTVVEQSAVAQYHAGKIFHNLLRAVIVDGWSAYQIELNKLTGHAWIPVTVIPWETTGNASGEDATFQAAALLTGLTGTPGVRGRKFIPGLSLLQVLQGHWTTTALVALAQSAVAYVTPDIAGSSAYTPGVVDKTWTFRPFIGGEVGNIVSSMRRRKPGYGI